jgi:hypothetical protein
MSRAIGPRLSLVPGGTAAGWIVLAACWGLATLAALIWAAAKIASTLTAGDVEPFGAKFVTALAHGRTTAAWPHTPAWAVGTASAVLLGVAAALTTVAVRFISRHWSAPGDPVAALPRNPRMLALTRLPVARAAIGLRRSLASADPRAIQLAETGLALGQLARPGHEPAVPTPIELLADVGHTAMAASLRGAQNGAVETRDGILTVSGDGRCPGPPQLKHPVWHGAALVRHCPAIPTGEHGKQQREEFFPIPIYGGSCSRRRG